MECDQGRRITSNRLSLKAQFNEQNTLLYPDERQLTKGIKYTEVPARLQSMVDSLVWESSRTEEGYGLDQMRYLGS